MRGTEPRIESGGVSTGDGNSATSPQGILIGLFPHERRPADPDHLRIRHGNSIPLREPDETGNPRHWILEIHFIDRAREIGGFYEELLTVDAGDADPHLAG